MHREETVHTAVGNRVKTASLTSAGSIFTTQLSCHFYGRFMLETIPGKVRGQVDHGTEEPEYRRSRPLAGQGGEF